MSSDCLSTFSYDNTGLEGDSFNLTELIKVVSTHFGEPCTLSKLAEGGYHKVYDVLHLDGRSPQAIVRVSAPAFPTDKMESEIATLKFVSSRTTIPVPRVYSWNSNSSNPVGAEYMIMEKVRGMAAIDAWDILNTEQKHVVVSQIAKSLVELFAHRFARGGSLYISSQIPPEFTVGPIVSTIFYRAIRGDLRVPSDEWKSLQQEQLRFRGPFTCVTDYLLSAMKAEIDFVKSHRPHLLPANSVNPMLAEAEVARGEDVLMAAMELCRLFPGDMPVYSPVTLPDRPFSLCLNDFSLSNIMIDVATGKVTGLIDFEGTTIAPAWACAAIPGWLLEQSSEDWAPGESSDDVRNELLQTFMRAIAEANPSGEWERALVAGRPYRYLLGLSQGSVLSWTYKKKYVNELLDWCKAHPGMVYDGPANPAQMFIEYTVRDPVTGRIKSGYLDRSTQQ